MPYTDPPTNPFDENTPDHEPLTRPMDEVVRDGIQEALKDVHVALPAMIVKVQGEQLVDVQPLLKMRMRTGELQDRPVVQAVPVAMPHGKDYYIKLPIAVGETGLLVFSDRSLDAWLAGGGGIVDPNDSRLHDINDAVFIPGVVPTGGQTQDGTTDLVVKNGDAVLRVQKAGTFQLKNASNELIDLLDQITKKVQETNDTLKIDTVNTIFGAEPLNNFLTYAQISLDLQALITKLETLKGG